MAVKLTTDAYYLAWTNDTDDAAQRLRERFIARYGRQPEVVMPAIGGIILAGPVPTSPRATVTTCERPTGQLALQV